ncbi:hypothetical protein ACIBCN_42705 [Nocardia sp. NPDC051052]|uniref:hypothetical protein n=1 Tax=Nocardia sp. NPDC051052 TaxID=3364322 RepID=UPI0037BDD351
MDLPRLWVGIDLISTRLHSEIVVHSAGGQRVGRRLRRVARKLGYDHSGEALFRGVVADVMNGPQLDHARAEAGIECRTHWITAADGTAVALLVWLAPPPVTPRPVYNSWIMDLRRLATAPDGDDLELYGVKRTVGEYKPIMGVFRNLNPDDAPAWTALIHNAGHQREGVTIDAAWSIRPDNNWVHFWSSTTNLGAPQPGRAVYGLTVQLPHRDLDTRLGTLVRYTDASLIMVDVRTRCVVAGSGDLADALLTDEPRLARVLTQIDLDRLVVAPANGVVEQTISIEGSLFQAALFAMPAGSLRPGSLFAILLSPASDRAR